MPPAEAIEVDDDDEGLLAGYENDSAPLDPPPPAAGEAAEVVTGELEEESEEVAEEEVTALTPDEEALLEEPAKKEDDKPDPMELMNKRIRTMEGKFGEINDKFQQLSKPSAQAVATGQAPSEGTIKQALVDPEKMEVLRLEWPEYADALESMAGQLESRLGQVQAAPDLEKLRAEVRAELLPEFEERMNERMQHQYLEIKHEGWEDVVKSKRFVEWAAKQPSEIQKWMDSPRGADAVKVLDRFKGDVAKAQNKRDLLESAAPATSGRAPEVTSAREMSEEQALAEGYKAGR